MSAKFILLMEVVSDFLDEYSKSTADEDKAWLMGMRGLENMHFNIAAEPKSVRLLVGGNKVAYFPPDYISWSKIGLLNENREVITLRVNKSLSIFKSDHPKRLELLTADVNNGINRGTLTGAYLNYFNGEGYAPLFGIGYGIQNFGECRVDEANGIIILAPDFQYDSVILEYISSPEKDVDYKVDRRLREPLIAFIAWKFKLDTDINYYARLVESRRMINPFNLQTFNQVVREQNKFSLKM